MTCKYKVKIKDIQYNYKVQMTDIQSKYKFKVFCTGYDDSEIKEKIDAMYQAWPKVSGEGETITLNDTANTTMAIDLKGNTYQETTTGKNKLDLTGLTTRTISAGITITPNFNGNLLQNIRISGTPTTSAWQTLKKVTLEAGSYILTGINISDTSKTGLRIGVYIDSSRRYFINANSTTYSFTLTEQTTMDFVVWAQNVDYYPSGDIYITPMIRLSSVSDATYEPYTNGASPNPDYQQTITNVTGTNTIKINGKNLLNYDNNTNYENKFINSNGEWQNDNEVYINEKIVLNSKVISIYVGSKTGNANIRLGQFKNDGTFISRTLINSTTNNITLDNECSYVWLSINKGSNLYFTNLSVVYGSSNTNYEAYKEQSYTINLGSIELCKIGDYRDRIYYSSGKWYLEKRIGKVVLDSTYRQSGGATGTNAYYISTTINGLNDNSLALSYSNMFQPCSFNNRVNGLDITYLQNGNLAIRTANNTSLDWSDNTKRDNWLNANNPLVYYVLATPTTEEITDSTLISQLEEIKEAESYSGQTNISQTNDDKPFILTAKALKDLSSL